MSSTNRPITIHPTEFRADNPDMEGAYPTAFVIRGMIGVPDTTVETRSMRVVLNRIADLEGVEEGSIEARPVYRNILDEIDGEGAVMWNVMDRCTVCTEDHGEIPELAALGWDRCPGHIG